MGGTGCLTGARTECRTAKRWACGIGRIYSISRLGPLFPLVLDSACSGHSWPAGADRLGTALERSTLSQGPSKDRVGTVFVFLGTARDRY